MQFESVLCIKVINRHFFQIRSESSLLSVLTSPRGFLWRGPALFLAAITASSLLKDFSKKGSLLSIKSGDLQSDSKLDLERILVFTGVFFTNRFSLFSSCKFSTFASMSFKSATAPRDGGGAAIMS